ncbi:WhiB family transcriptional regulator [Streptomyces lydicus]|uniref:WhiB family transcriptional regulator n=1 Tax=Streptomyces lydicus TaxID=47763 RepID=UPI0037014FAE
MPKLPCQTARETFDNPRKNNEAKTACADCPIRHDCLRTALANNETFGVRGGLDPNERWQLTHKDGTWLDTGGTIRQPCGTEKALKQHRALKEKCPVCLAADQRRHLDVEHALPGGGSASGAHYHRLLGEEPCDPCRAAFVASVKAHHPSRRGEQVAA